MNIAFSPITAADKEAVTNLMEAFYAIDHYPFDRTVAGQLLDEFTANPHLGRGWLITVDGEITGYVILTFVFSFEYKGRIAFLDELYIAENVRGKGLGKQTLDFIHEQAKALDIKIIYLEVEGHNDVALKLYSAKNYTVHNRRLMKLEVK